GPPDRLVTPTKRPAAFTPSHVPPAWRSRGASHRPSAEGAGAAAGRARNSSRLAATWRIPPGGGTTRTSVHMPDGEKSALQAAAAPRKAPGRLLLRGQHQEQHLPVLGGAGLQKG